MALARTAAVFLLAVGLSGCVAFGKYGKPTTVDYFDITQPDFLKNKTKLEILEAYGIPDIILEAEKVTSGEKAEAGKKAAAGERWGYRLKRGFFIILYGESEQKDLILEFKDDVVVKTHLLKKGSSVGFLVPPGGVAN